MLLTFLPNVKWFYYVWVTLSMSIFLRIYYILSDVLPPYSYQTCIFDMTQTQVFIIEECSLTIKAMYFYCPFKGSLTFSHLAYHLIEYMFCQYPPSVIQTGLLSYYILIFLYFTLKLEIYWVINQIKNLVLLL